LGWLLVREPDPDGWRVVTSMAGQSPAALLLPALMIALGIWTLRRKVATLSRLEAQLSRLPVEDEGVVDAVQPLAPADPVAKAWNRLIEIFRRQRGGGDLSARLNLALEGYRQQKSDQVLNSLTDGIAVTDQNGRITLANRSFAVLLGMTGKGQSCLGQTVEKCLGLTKAGEAARPLLDPQHNGRRVVAEINDSPVMPPGTYRVSRSPKCGAAAGATVPGYVWAVRDVTQQKLADRMRDQFVSTATHELRTPLANIKAHAEAIGLCGDIDVEQQKVFCNTIDDEVTRLADFVDDLLDLSRMEAGSTSLTLQVTDMERLLHDTVGKVSGEMEKKKLAFDVRLPGKLPELAVDKDKIVVALVNLLGNAAKYTPEEGQVRLHVDQTDGALLIHIEDSGIGISVEEQAHIFDKFFRSCDVRVQDITGSGLGLSLTNEIVRLHGGRLTVHSELNKGSRFTVKLPLSREMSRCSNA
jgi:signal transduction histidine kinase